MEVGWELQSRLKESMLLRALPGHVLNVSKDGDSTVT